MAETETCEVAAREDTFVAAYRSHFGDLLGFLVRRLRSRAVAEDMVHEAFLRLSQSPAQVRNPRAFLFEIAANLARNHVRDEGRRAQILEGKHLLQETVEHRTPERVLLAADELVRIRNAISSLPPRCREVFALSRFDGLSQREIAARLGISTTAVEKSMRRAFAHLLAAADGNLPNTKSNRG